MKKILIEKIKRIKVLALDVDGVLTTGKIVLDHQGKDIKIFNVKDGYGIALFKRAGLKTAIISARASGAVTARAKDLKIDKVYQDAYPKIHAFKKMMKDLKVSKKEVCFVGDDIPDICVIREAGLGIAVADAVNDVKKAADLVTKNNGGEGAVREIVLNSNNVFNKLCNRFNLINSNRPIASNSNFIIFTIFNFSI